MRGTCVIEEKADTASKAQSGRSTVVMSARMKCAWGTP
jgi:hypothetical protein